MRIIDQKSKEIRGVVYAALRDVMFDRREKILEAHYENLDDQVLHGQLIELNGLIKALNFFIMDLDNR